MNRRENYYGKTYCLSSFSKTGQNSIAEYIRKIIIRIAKSRPLYRDEYAVICEKLANKFSRMTAPILRSLGVDYGRPIDVGYGKFLPTGHFEIRPWEIDPIEISEADFCFISKSKGCHICFVYLKNNDYFCKKCSLILDRHRKDNIEAKELRSLTRKLEKLCNEKNKTNSSIPH